MRKKLVKFIRLILWKAFKLVPTNFKHRLIRNQFSVSLPNGVYSDIEYKMAETQKEKEEALSLVQESYVETKLTTDDKTIYRVSKYNLLPTTIIFIAKYKGEIIATVSQIMDTSLGLPVDSFTNIESLRSNGKKISEISCLAIDKKWRSRSTGVFFPLTTYAILYCKDILGVDSAVMVTRASVRHFYTALYGFVPIENKVKKHDKVNQKASFAQILDLNSLNSNLKRVYRNKPLDKNMYYLSVQFPWRHQCDFRRRKFNIISNKHFTTLELERLFSNNPSLSENISQSDRRNLASIYFHNNLAQVFSTEEFHYATKRKFPRFQVNMEIKMGIESFKVIEVSKQGFCLIGSPKDYVLSGIFHMNNEISCEFEAIKAWSYKGRTGFKIKNISGVAWDEMINFSEDFTLRKLVINNEDMDHDDVA